MAGDVSPEGCCGYLLYNSMVRFSVSYSALCHHQNNKHNTQEERRMQYTKKNGRASKRGTWHSTKHMLRQCRLQRFAAWFPAVLVFRFNSDFFPPSLPSSLAFYLLLDSTFAV